MGFILDLQFFGLEYEKGATSAITQKLFPMNSAKAIQTETLVFVEMSFIWFTDFQEK